MWYDRAVRSRGLASTVVGVSLAVLIALASVVAGWAIWERATERQQADDERASLAVVEALSTSVGRSLAIMRAASGLVDPDGSVDTGTFYGFAQGITVVGSANVVVLARAVPGASRARFEAAQRRPIVQVVRPGVYEPAPVRARYLPVVAVWPDTAANRPLLGLDLLRDAARRLAADEAARRRDAVLTSFVPLAVNRTGFLAFQPVYAPGRARGRPVAYVTASFATDRIATELSRLTSEFRIRVTSGDATVYQTPEPPSGGDRRTLVLAGSPWVVRAEGRPASRLEPFVVVGTGIALAALLAVFALTRASSERRLLRANAAERRARDRSEALARDAELLATVSETLEQSTTAEGRARRVVEALVEGGVGFAGVHLADEETGALVGIAAAGGRPPELADDEVWLAHVRRAIAAMGVLPVRPRRGDEEPELVVLPLRARGRALGTLTLDAPAGDRRAVSTGLAREVAGVAALALDNARLYERERGVSHALQLGLLGKALSFEDVSISAAYRPGAEALEVGGDWYDAFELTDGSVALVVGDVVGHGLAAAVAMGQLRGAVRALARAGGTPAVVLRQLDMFVESVPDAAGATLAYVELDPERGRLVYACAGHPPPLVVPPDGDATYLWDGRSAPLGSILGTERTEAVARLSGGETLVLYTDGLIERRGEGLDEGLDRLAAEAVLRAPEGGALADELADALLEGEGQADDVCVLTARRFPAAPVFSHAFRARPSELAPLRQRLGAWLDAQNVDPDAQRSVVLAVSEAAANAVEHGHGSDGLGVVSVMARVDDGRVALSVRDRGGWREPGDPGDRGRGLPIIEAIVDEVSIEQTEGGTVVRMESATGAA